MAETRATTLSFRTARLQSVGDIMETMSMFYTVSTINMFCAWPRTALVTPAKQ